MTCEERDSELLLYGLGELSPLRRMVTAWHLSRCRRCQARQVHLASVSRQMAGALRPPHGPRSGPVAATPLIPAWLTAIVIVVVLTISILTVRLIVSYS